VPPTGQLAGRIALITGAARGIGQAIAEAFGREGAAVMLVDQDEPAVGELAARLTGQDIRCSWQGVDVTDSAAVRELVQRTLAELGGLDILVNNAGVCSTMPLVDLPLEEWRRVIDTDLTSVFLCSQAVLPSMIAQRDGRIINIGSQLASKGAELMVHYCAAKSGVHGFTRALAREVAQHNITVNVIAPGPTETDMLRADPQEWLDSKLEELPLGRFARPEEIAPTAVLLASRGGSYYTGATLNVSGGDVM
jgi:3-oxoacyl-[acyl-carrier protein] reductase